MKWKWSSPVRNTMPLLAGEGATPLVLGAGFWSKKKMQRFTVTAAAWVSGLTLPFLLLPQLALPAEVEGLPAVVSCASLAGKSFYNVAVTGAVNVPADGAVPTYCKVIGTERGTQHDIEVRLPARWRERYVQRGGGGFDGTIPPIALSVPALLAGAVQGANNGGHRDRTGADLLDDPRAVERYAHGAILTATRFGKAIAQLYYGSYPKHSYYEGCSNGGRGAFNAAAKYGNEFDGVIAGAPTRNLGGQIAQWTSATSLTMPSTAQFSGLHAAAVAKCDAQDGLKDGIISNWAACKLDPSDVSAQLGMTEVQVASVRVLQQGLRRKDGAVVASPFSNGDLGTSATTFPLLFGVGQMRYIVLNDPTWNPQKFDLEPALPRISSVVDDKYQFSASRDDLVQYLKAGRKVIVWHGADDGMLSPFDTIRGWSEVTNAAGAQVAAANSRLYIAPGVNHCGGGDGADSIDMLGALIQWVESGKAPGTLLAVKRDAASGKVRFTRPLCQFPAWPRYRGSGDPADAATFSCATQ
ncbi:MAG: tannase/feruloyl esterase family alpha/beta hydrolase [Pseudomonadota bacterium]